MLNLKCFSSSRSAFQVLSSRHIDTIELTSVMEPVCVLTFNEYARYYIILLYCASLNENTENSRFMAENAQDLLPSAVQSSMTLAWPRGEDVYKRRYRLPREDTPTETVNFA